MYIIELKNSEIFFTVTNKSLNYSQIITILD